MPFYLIINMLLVLFGLSGSGKNFIANVLVKKFNFTHLDLDNCIQRDLKNAILKNKIPTDAQRNEFYDAAIQRTKKALATHKRLVVSQAFIKNKYRVLFRKAFPSSIWILV